ncbi:MAG: hypothetical protein NTX64_06045 [Elusimicrobia bacterium]|nr:hypothetical protein [Elusimicrobiota bacterium]
MASNPEIPSFKNPGDGKKDEPKEEEKKSGALPSRSGSASQEKKTGGGSLFGRAATAPKTPTFGATPQLKVRGLSGGPKTLFERLKQFQKKDLIFIASGLGVLFLAPLAEHFMMNPTQEKTMTPGFNSPGSGSFGPEAGVHEPGTGGLSPGGLVGASSDIITPLNVRDPSALVMAPGATAIQPSPAAATVAPAQASASKDSSWKDALAQAAKDGATKGSDAAKPAAFKAPGAMAGALRGLSALSGGSYGGGPTYSLSAPNANGVPNHPTGSNSLSQVQSAPGYRGVGSHGLDQGGNADALMKAGQNAADKFNRAGGAANNLESAAKEVIPNGGAVNTGGGTSGGDANKAPGGNNSKDNKALGESLAYLKAKMEMEKALDLKWSKKKWQEFEFPKMIYEEITKSAISNILGKGLFEPLGKSLAGAWSGLSGGGPKTTYCDGYGMTDGATQAYSCHGGDGPDRWVDISNTDSNGNGTVGGQYPAQGVCKYCFSTGGKGAGSGTGSGAGSKDLVNNVPPTQNPQSQVDSGKSSLASNCSNPQDPTVKTACDSDGKKILDGAYTKYTQVNSAVKNAQQRLGDALTSMKATVQDLSNDAQQMQTENQNLNQGGKDASGALAQAQAALAALKQADLDKSDATKLAKDLTDAGTAIGKVQQTVANAQADANSGNISKSNAQAQQDIANAVQALNDAIAQARTAGGVMYDAETAVKGVQTSPNTGGGPPADRTLSLMASNVAADGKPTHDTLAALAGPAIIGKDSANAQIGGKLQDAVNAYNSVAAANAATCGKACATPGNPPNVPQPPAYANLKEASSAFDKLNDASNSKSALSTIGGLPAPTAENYSADKDQLVKLIPDASGATGASAPAQPTAPGASTSAGTPSADATGQLAALQSSLSTANGTIQSALNGSAAVSPSAAPKPGK